MSLLTASEDELRYDPLRDNNSGKGYDPLSKEESSRVKIYDKGLGYALHPEEKKATLAYKDNVANAEAEQIKSLEEYKGTYAKSMAEADKKATGLLAQIKNAPEQGVVAVKIVGNGKVESTHYVNKDWADTYLSQGSQADAEARLKGFLGDETSVGKSNLNSDSKGLWTPTKSEDGTWLIDANDYGKELRDILTSAEEQTNIANEKVAAANEGINKTRQGAEAAISSSRGIAQANYEQEVAQAKITIDNTKGLWTRHIADQQAAFAKGKETNTGGIKDLLDSGALTMSPGSNTK